jgi:methyltransferase (TIGR00027 family)
MGPSDTIENVAFTAFYCCAVRAADAESAHPVCGDALAFRFLDDGVLAKLAPLLRHEGPAATNVARHRLIDDIARSAIERDPDMRVILIGAGFDTRAYRLGGGRWWEIDDANLLNFKETRLPASDSPRPLARLPFDYRHESLLDRLAPLAGDDQALVILEGVSEYLSLHDLTSLASSVRSRLPHASFACELMTPAFRRWSAGGIARDLARMGAEFAPTAGHPKGAIEAAGYRSTGMQSIMERARLAGTIHIPKWLLDSVFRTLRDGYAVWTFEPK